MGLALYNSMILSVQFPLFLFKIIKSHMPSRINNEKPLGTLEDLKDVDPLMYKGLNEILNYEGDVTDFGLNFSVSTSSFGEVRIHDLKPKGRDIPVTNENRKEYVDLVIQWKLIDNVKPQISAFLDGFLLVCDINYPSIKMLSSEELEVLICGERVLDWKELEQYTRYDNGYSATHPLIKEFWAYFHSLPEETKKQFLRFCTGTDRCPIGGLKNVGLVIARHGDTTKLPTASTCFTRFFLPDYKNVAAMKKKVSQAIQYSTGFGLL